MSLDIDEILEGIRFREAVSLTAEFKWKTMTYTVLDYNICSILSLKLLNGNPLQNFNHSNRLSLSMQNH